MKIREIGREVRFGQYFRRYREFMSLNFRMRILCYRYVIVYVYYTHIVLLQRSDDTWFYASRSLLYFSKEVVLSYYYASTFVSYSDDVMVCSIFYDYKRKHCHVDVILSHGRIFSTDWLLY